MIRIFRSTFLLSLVILLIINVNYNVDPANLVHGNYYSMAISILKSEFGVVQTKNLDERTLKKELLKNVRSIDNLILGSSRVMEIRNDFIEGNIINAGVSGATIEDYIALYQVYSSSHTESPKRVIIGVDPWIFNDNNNQNRWQELSNEFENGSLTLNSHSLQNTIFNAEYLFQKIIPKSKQQMLSLSYFQASLDSLKENNFQFPQNDAFEFSYADGLSSDLGHTIVQDGSLIYSTSYINSHKEPISHYGYSLDNFNHLSSKYVNYFENFINYLTDKDIEVVFYIPPYNPEYVNKLKNDPNNNYYIMINSVDTYVRELATKKNIIVLGSYYYPIQTEDFHDGIHAKSTAIKKIFKESL